jgi:uncharacterized MAPEG superfamily protein
VTIPFVCVFVAFLLIYVSRFFVTVGQAKIAGGYDNANPRDQQAKLEGLPRRALAAHLNSFEAFAPFAAAVFVAHLAHAPEGTASTLAIGFIVARVLYVGAYLADVPTLRSTVWTLGMLCTTGLFVLPLVTRA